MLHHHISILIFVSKKKIGCVCVCVYIYHPFRNFLLGLFGRFGSYWWCTSNGCRGRETRSSSVISRLRNTGGFKSGKASVRVISRLSIRIISRLRNTGSFKSRKTSVRVISRSRLSRDITGITGRSRCTSRRRNTVRIRFLTRRLLYILLVSF